jgi:hypothetical protein
MQYHPTITEKEAKERFQLADYIQTLHGDEYRYLLLKGDVVTAEFYYLDTYAIVDGNLTIKEALHETDTEYGQTIFVTGNLYAQSICKGGGELYIKGNLVVEESIYVFYDNGRLTVEGDTKATTIFAEDQYCKFGGDIQGLLISTGEVDGAVADFGTTEPLLDELIDTDKQGSHEILLQYINEGRNIIKEQYIKAGLKK